MADLLDELASDGEEEDPLEQLDIFADRTNNTLEKSIQGTDAKNFKKKNAWNDHAMDSTFISLHQQEHDFTAEHIKSCMFDHTLDNMSQTIDDADASVSELLRKKASSFCMSRSRSRFISDDTIFSIRKNHGLINSLLDDTPDK